MALTDPVVMPLAEALLECLGQEIAKVEDPPRFLGLRPGTQVDHLLSMHDDECCSGKAWVRVVSFAPSSGVFPNQDVEWVKGASAGALAWAITLEMGVVRCAPTPGPNAIPSDVEWGGVVQAIMDDAAAMRRALCCFIDNDGDTRKRQVVPGTWEPAPVEGGCVGGVMTLTVKGPACDCESAGPASS